MSMDVRPEDQRIEVGTLLGAIARRWLRVVLVTLVLLGLTFAILLFVPRVYESTASILVEQRTNITTTRTEGGGSSTPSIPVEAMMSSQIELIKSRDTLMGVIDKENLRSEPEFAGAGQSALGFLMQLMGRPPEQGSVDERVLANLNERLSVARERDSAVISISVGSRDPELAARIANAIAEAHVSRRTALSLSDTAEASEWLDQEIRRLRVAVKEADEAVASFRVDNDLFTGAGNTSLLDQQLTTISAQITEVQQRKNAAQSRANLIRELIASGRPIDAVPDVRNSVVIQQLSQTKATLQGELAQRSSTLLPNHPNIRALTAQVREIEQQITAEARRVADALEAEAQIEADTEESLREDLARIKLSVSNASKNTVTLEGLQREAKAQRDLLEAYLLRYSDAVSRTEAGSALPDVRQITLAAPSVTPAFPKTTLTLSAVAFVALALQIGGILFGELVSGRAISHRHAYRQVHDDDFEAVSSEPPVVADLFEAERPPVGMDEEALDETVPPAPDRVAAEEEHENSEEQPDVIFDEEAHGAVTESLAMGAGDPAPRADDDEHIAAYAEVDVEPEPLPPVFGTPDVGDSAVAAAEVPLEGDDVPREAVPVATTTAGEDALELSNLSADIALGRVRVVMLASLTEQRASDAVASTLIEDALYRGLSVVRIDAGSGRPSAEPGITDLSTERASFGDVVHRVREGLAEVPWGQEAELERRSPRPATLIEALTDIYEVVIVQTGRIGMSSSLSMFSGIDCRLVLVGGRSLTREMVEAAVEDAANLGYEVGQIVRAPQRQTEVA